MRVLIVEDSPATRSFVQASLESGFGAQDDVDIVQATGGFDALRLLPRGPYDLVVTDINMQDINGLELLNFIRKSPQHQSTPVLLISTQASEKDRARGMKLGANAFLPKPFSAEVLNEAVQKIVQRRA